MIRFMIALAILAISTAVGYMIKTFPANVLIALPGKNISVNFIVWLLLSLAFAYIALILFKIALFLWRSPQIFSRSSKVRKSRKADRLLKSGLSHLIAGHYAKAEKELVNGAVLSDELGRRSAIYYENAAIAADNQQAPERRNTYLLKARQTADHKQTHMVYFAEAEMHLNNHDYAKARPLLEEIQRREPKNPKLQLLLDQTYAAQADWQQAWALLPKLRKQLNLDDYEARRRHYAKGLLNDTPEIDSYEHLAKAWKKLPADLRNDAEMILEYANALVENQHPDKAAQLLAAELKHRDNLAMLQAYGQLDNVDHKAQLRTIDAIASRHSEEQLYHYTRALVAYKAQALDIAAQAIETALKLQHTPEAFTLWAQILEAQNQPEAALAAYRQSVQRIELTEALAGDLLPAAVANTVVTQSDSHPS